MFKQHHENIMKQRILALFLILSCTGTALAGGLDDFLGNLNAQAYADRHGAVASVGSHFGVPFGDVELIIGTTGSLADAFMILQLGRMTGLPRTRVMDVYHRRHGQGWGVVAQELGIKPGSSQFHAFKRGDFGYVQAGSNHGRGSSEKPDHGQGAGKGRKK